LHGCSDSVGKGKKVEEIGMNEIELARLKRRLKIVSEEAQEATKTLRIFAAQCEEVSRIMSSIRDSYTLVAVPDSSPSTKDSEFASVDSSTGQAPVLTLVDGDR